MFTCDFCQTQFKNKSTLNRHRREKHDEKSAKLECSYCGIKFHRKENLNRHKDRAHNFLNPVYTCILCKKEFTKIEEYHNHKTNDHQFSGKFELYEHSLKGTCKIYRRIFSPLDKMKSAADLFSYHNKKQMIDRLENHFLEYSGFKINVYISVEIFKLNNRNQELERMTHSGKTFASNPIYLMEDIEPALSNAEEQVDSILRKLEVNESDIHIDYINFMDLQIGNCISLNGACQLKQILIKKPNDLDKIKKVYDKNRYKDACLLYCVARFFCKTDDTQILNNFINTKLQVKINLPAEISQLKSFENHNSNLNFKINVFRREKIYDTDTHKSSNMIFPLHISKNKTKKCKIINLIWAQYEKEDDENDEETNASEYHFFLIKNINKFLSNEDYLNRFHCVNCLSSFYSAKGLAKHEVDCFKFASQKVVVPTHENNILKFKDFAKKFPCPFIGFYDFEAMLVPAKFECKKCKSTTSCDHRTKIHNIQQPISYALIIVDTTSKNIIMQKVYTGEDCTKNLLETLISLGKELIQRMSAFKDIIELSKEEQKSYMRAKTCHICDDLFQDDPNGELIKVRDHCHFTGKFLGAAHKNCNRNRRIYKKIPMFAHNANKYDSHFVIQALSGMNIKSISGLPSNTEHFKTLEIENFQFLDSLAFLNFSLDKLVSDLRQEKDYEYRILDQTRLYPKREQMKKELLLRKGIFPYEYFTDIKILEEKDFPTKDKFFSTLRGENISDEDYKHGQIVYKTFNCKNFKDYLELYVLSDTALLAEVFLQFRDVIYKDSGLEAAKFMSLPQLSFQIFLKMTKVNIELLTDIDQIIMCENVRGGLSFVHQRYAKVDPTNKREEIIYIDANSLYGHAMTQPLPIRGFRWLSREEIENIDWANVNEYGKEGYLLEIDLHYPPHLHKKHRYFPVVADQKRITYKDLSPYARTCLEQLKCTKTYTSEKLTATFEDKERYVCYFANLKLYLKLGLVLKKIHRVLRFEQEPFLKPYIDIYTEKRKRTKSPFQSLIIKCQINSVFGKLLENTRNRKDCKFVRGHLRCKRLISKPTYHSFCILGEDLVTVYNIKDVINLDKAYPAGNVVLEWSKHHMIRTYHLILADRFLIFKIIYSDTDSFLAEVLKKAEDENKSVFEIIKDIMDFSNYPPDHPLYDKSRKNERGFFKDETAGISISEFVGIRAKTYAFKLIDGTVERKAKGVSKNVQDMIHFDEYKKCIEKISQQKVTQYSIRSNNHQLSTQFLTKTSFTSFDDKFYLMPCGIHAFPYGSIEIPNESTNYCNECLETDLLSKNQTTSN